MPERPAQPLDPTVPVQSPVEGSGPERLGDYAVLDRIGAGGMGTVLRVADAALGRTVAAKVGRGAADDLQRAKFLLEAQVTGQLEHPNIIPVHALGHDADGAPFFTMKEVRGRELEQAIAAHHRGDADAPTRNQLLEMFLKACDAVAFAHARGVLHRDLKPANIMVGEYGEVLVMDWGLAKLVGDEAGDRARRAVTLDLDDREGPPKTLDGEVMGTPAYMPPEQADGAIERIDARSDIYSLGAILYHLLTGVPPFEGGTAWQIIARVSEGDLAAPSTRAAEVPWELEAVVLRAMAFDREARYADVRTMQADVRAWLEGGRVSAARYTVWAALRNWAARNRNLLRGAAAVLATAVVFGAVGLHQARQRAAARAAALAAAVAEAEATDARAWIARASAATRDLPADVTARKLPAGTELTTLGELIGRLRAASDAHDAVLALQRDHPLRGRQYRVLLALGRVGEAAHEDALAAMAYGAASRLAVGERHRRQAAALAVRAGGASAARANRRGRRLDALLTAAREGQLVADRYTSALIELASFRDRQTVERLVALGDAIADALEAVTREQLDVAAPDAAEQAAGEPALTGLPAAVEAWIATPRGLDGALGPPGPALRAGLRRFAARARREGSGQTTPETLLAAAQDRALLRRGPGWEVEVRLLSEVLGRIGEARRVAPTLRRLIWADWDARRARPPALALARLAQADRRLTAWLLRLIGYVDRVGRHSEGALPELVVRALPREHLGESGKGQRTPGIAEALRASLLLDQGDLDGAREQVARGLAIAKDQPLVQVMAGRVAWRAGEMDEAMRRFDRAVALDADHVEARRSRAHARAHLGQLEGAREDVDRMLARTPGSVLAWSLRAFVRNQAGDHAGALEDCARALTIDPDFPNALQNRGSALHGLGRLDEATAALRRAVELDPRNSQALILLAQIAIERQRLEQAETLIRRAMAIAPRHPVVLGYGGIIRGHRGDFRGAVEILTRALAIAPSSPILLLNRANAYARMGRHEAALADLGALLSRTPGNRLARERRALLRFELRDVDGWAEDAEELVRRFPKAALGYRLRGDATLMRGDARAALVDLERALALAPDDVDCRIARGHARQRLGQLEGARADYDAAVARAPGYWRGWFLRGGLRLMSRDVEGAIADLRKAIEVAPERWDTRRLFARLLSVSGDREGAVREMREALKRAPTQARGQIEMELRRLTGR